MFAIPIFDRLAAIVRRKLTGRSIYATDRAHIHHILLRRGLSPARVVTLLLGANVALAAIGSLGWAAGVPQTWLFATYLAVDLAYLGMFLFPARLIKRRRTARVSSAGPSP